MDPREGNATEDIEWHHFIPWVIKGIRRASLFCCEACVGSPELDVYG